MYEGRALRMTAALSTDLSWLKDSSHPKEDLNMGFEVHPDPDDWLVLGKKKGHYRALVRYSIPPQISLTCLSAKERENNTSSWSLCGPVICSCLAFRLNSSRRAEEA